MKSPGYILLIILSLLTLGSCKKENPQADTDNLFKFKEYIYYTTTGVVSINEDVQIGLANEVEGWVANSDISEDVFSISPSVKGKLVAQNSRTFSFIPTNGLTPNTEYTVRVKLNKLYPSVNKAFKTYTFKFKTIEPNFTINTNNLQSYSKEWQYIEGVLNSADAMSLSSLKDLIEVNQKGTSLSVKWDSISSTVFAFKIDSIKRLKEDSEIQIKWDGKKIGVDNNGSSERAIPGLNNFTIVNVSVQQSPEQYIEINFSDPVKKQQTFNGLVAVENVKNLRYTAD